MTKYANKTCYDCAVIKPANQMYRVTESYNSGRSDRRPDAANVAGFLFSDTKTSQNMIKGALTKNNRRVYTRNRTVWKCGSCSGHDAAVARQERDFAVKAEKAQYRREQREITNREFDAKGGWTRIFNNFAMFLTGFITVAFGMALLQGQVTVDHPDFIKTMPFVAIFAFTLYKRRGLKKEYLRQTC